jgi:capsular exopolysaccharide synthesis family protein
MNSTQNAEQNNRISVGPFIIEAETLMAEQFRKLRSVLKVHYLGNGLRSVLITSLAPDEGKTTVSLNLSATVAKGLEESVILLDADLRRKGLTTLLGLQEKSGLSEVLLGKAKLKETFIQTDIEGFSIMPAGVDSSHSAELIESKRMTTLLNVLRDCGQFSYIVIDSSPLISTSEAHTLSHLADGVLVVVMAEKTRRDIVRRELGVIDRTKILGVVLNAAHFETSHYYNKYYSKYYGKE